MKVVELIIDETDLESGVDCISIVEHPAIEENWVALKDEKKEFQFKEVDKDQRILLGALLVPNKTIYRQDGPDQEPYYIFFNKDTVRLASELFMQRGYQNNASYEHIEKIKGLTLVESWIIESKDQDKSNLYDLDLPVGTWVGAVRVHNDKIWADIKESGTLNGFSIEGMFGEKYQTEVKAHKQEIEDGLKLLAIKKALLENGK